MAAPDATARDASRNILCDGRVTADTWRGYPVEHGDGDGDQVCPPDEAGYRVTLQNWMAHRRQYRRRRHPVAVWLAPDADPAELLEPGATTIDPTGLAMIAIDFPVYTDGRGYSIAQLLRHQLGWEGALRAVGDVMIDTVHYLARCGFDSFALKPGHDPEAALRALSTFSASYQRAYAMPVRR
ncbi:conserved protein of unknown function, UCP030820 [Ralstonia solanacearum CMR15]|nr:conserved protein of unknown function, UCP030820 [Ralstonia solanacearum CMR15]